jgi:hypothetical protein
MPQSALYFPYISLPTNRWTVQSILYWDTLKTIVPVDQLRHPERLDRLTRDLLEEGLIESIIPGMYLWQVPGFRDSFVEYLEHQRVRLRVGQNWLAGGAPAWVRVHFEKMGDIADYLVQVQLARKIDYSWYEVEPRVASRFMCYLACVLGALPEVQATAVTDRATNVVGMRPTTPRHGDLQMHRDKARDAVLGFLLPIPSGSVSTNRLLQFKERHGHLLPAFRTRIEARCAQIANLQTAEERLDATTEFIQECAYERAEIEAAMKPSFGKVVLGSLVPLFGNGLVLRALDPEPTQAVFGASLVLANAVYTALDSIRGPRKLNEKRALAYVSMAGKSLGLRN